MSKSKNNLNPSVYIGEVFTSTKGQQFEIVEYVKAIKVKIRFLTEPYYEGWSNVSSIRRGNVKNPYYRGVYGIGFIGEGPYKSKNGNVSDEAYNRWKNMLARCYDGATKIKLAAYEGCTVHPHWHNFQNYAEWFYKNPFYTFGWNVDKDLLIFGNREYGPHTCVLLPPAINSALQMRGDKADGLPHGVKVNSSCSHLFEASSSVFDKKHYIGLYPTVEEAYAAYKSFRENHVKSLVLNYQGKIDPVVYEKLMNFKVEDYGR